MKPTNQDKVTTIGLRESTKQLLDQLRVGDESYNSVLVRVLSSGKGVIANEPKNTALETMKRNHGY